MLERISKHNSVMAQSDAAWFPAASTGRLQRRCACGQPITAGGECAECRQKRLALQRRAVNQSRSSVPGDRQESNYRASPRFSHDFSRVPAQQNVRVQSAPVNDFEDCPPAWQREANNALVLARKWLANVITGLVNLPYPFPAPVAALLNRHFRITGRGYVYEVLRHYITINAALNSPIDFECETSCDDNVAAYVYSIWSDVHLCPVWHNQTLIGQANTIIHEIAHDAANRDDEAYIWEAKYSKLSVEDAIDNADSYSHFAQEAYYGP